MTWMQKRGSKYGAKRTVTGGRQYDSKMEAGYAQRLELLRLAGEVLEVRPQVTLHLYANGRKVCAYRMDFVVTTAPGCYRFDEVKGFETPLWSLKWKLLEANLDEPIFREKNGFLPSDDLSMLLVK